METLTSNVEDELTTENLDVFLQDSMFIQFFNNFLSLQAFPHRLLYNAIKDHFEEFECDIVDCVRKPPSNRTIRSTEKEKWTQRGYYLKTVEKEEGLTWINKYRLPLFKRSEIYADFKLAKLLTSYQINLFQKFFQPELEFLCKLVKNTSKGISKDESDGKTLIDNFMDKVDGNETNSSSAEDVHDLNSSAVPTILFDKLDNITFLNDYIWSTPLIKENILKNNADDRTAEDEVCEESNIRVVNVNILLQKLYRNIKLQEMTDNVNQESKCVIRDFHQRVNDILLAIDSLRRKIDSDVIDIRDHEFHHLLKMAEIWPINLSCKKGIDAFKEFLHGTLGEGNLLLWMKLEVSKHSNPAEKKRIFQDIKEKFFRSDSPYHIPKQSLKSMGIELTSNLTLEELMSCQKKILNPLLIYWCPRFSLHLYREKLQYEKGQKISATQDWLHCNLPSRPLSCTNRPQAKDMGKRIIPDFAPVRDTAATDLFSESSVSDTKEDRTNSPFFSVRSFDGMNHYMSRKSRSCVSSVEMFDQASVDLFDAVRPGSQGITNQTRRAKSAHPRILTTPNSKSTNASYEQLLLSSHPYKEGFGYKPLPIKYFHNDASDQTHRRNVRLYVAPFPNLDADVSTISLKCNFTHENEDCGCNRCNLDSLIEVLLHETHTGDYFLKYLVEKDTKLWLDCYLFWKSLQDYNEYFVSNSFAPAAVKRKANYIYSNFIPAGSAHDIQCSPSLQSSIFKQLDPPFEDLFDIAEEQALICLLQPYTSFLQTEDRHYKELTLKKELKYIEVPPSIKKSRHPADEEELEIPKVLEEHSRDKDKIPPDLVDQIPQYADGFSFDTLLRSKTEMEHFRTFLELHHKQGILDLKAWTDFEVFRISPGGKNDETSARDRKSMENREKWLGKSYFFGPHSPATKAGQKKILELAGKVQFLPERPSTPVSLEAQKYIRARLERKWLVLFKDSAAYQERMRSEENTNKMVEDLLMQKQLRRGANSIKARHIAFTNAKLAALRMTISDPQECLLFRKFIKVYGESMSFDFPENNLDFWLEVQKYKDLCHNHVEESLIKKKIQAIIDVYIKSSVPPEVQIDVSSDIASRLYEKACGRPPQHSPYIFREAQTTVIRVMYDNWNEFVSFRQKFADQLKLQESLKTSEVQYRSEHTKRKLLLERKRLWKLLTDKNKQEQKEVDSSQVQDLLQLVQKNRENEDTGDTTSFVYSKHLAEEDLNELETRMREQGFTDFDKFSSKKSTNSNVSPRYSRRTSSALAQREKGGSECSDMGISLNPYMATKDRSSYGGSTITSRKKSMFRRRSSLKKNDSLSSVNDLHFIKNKTLETLEENNEDDDADSSLLTRKSLEQFSKSPEGKQLKIPLPIVRIQSSSLPPQIENGKNGRLPVINEVGSSQRKNKKKQKNLRSRPLPRNAGTASIIARMEREPRLVESPPPEINAVVVVY